MYEKILGKEADNVQSLNSEKMYINILASSLGIVQKYDWMIGEIDAAINYSKYAMYIIKKLDSCLVWDDDQFLDELKHILEEIETSMGEEQLIYAIEFCKWLDFHITYVREETDLKNKKSGKRYYVSLYHLVNTESNKIVRIGALNSNYNDTKIWINPKFPVCYPYVIRDGKKEDYDFSSRDAFEGINGSLNNCCYFVFDDKNYISNVILPSDFLSNDKKFLRIGFSPMSDNKSILNVESVDWIRNGMQQNGIAMGPILCSELINQRFCEDFKYAGSKNVDILFTPEMLGIEAMEISRGRKNSTIYELSKEMQENFLPVPGMIVLPSYWTNFSNTATITDGTGEILGKQEKHVPYLDKRKHRIEALQERDKWNTVLIHVPQKFRMAVIICAEFLNGKDEGIFDLVCGSLGASLIIVPSYSGGETDFINALSSLKMYGTTVVWGNCCGAIKPDEKAIGGCGIAGTQLTDVFSRVCKCRYSCNGVESCIFILDIPLEYEYTKHSDVHVAIIDHLLEKRRFEYDAS